MTDANLDNRYVSFVRITRGLSVLFVCGLIWRIGNFVNTVGCNSLIEKLVILM